MKFLKRSIYFLKPRDLIHGGYAGLLFKRGGKMRVGEVGKSGGRGVWRNFIEKLLKKLDIVNPSAYFSKLL